MKELTEIIRREIEARGAIPFARFMELALYCPEFGYYDRFANTVGKTGDFYTSVSVGPLFGQLLAFQFARWIETAQLKSPRLLEAGVHDGQLAVDILDWFRSVRPSVFERLEYWILEPAPRRQRRQKKTLGRLAAKVRWFHSWETLPKSGVRGVIFSNELLDALPAHRLGWDAKAKVWFEWGVGVEGENFVWARMPAPRSEVFSPRPASGGSYCEELPAELLDLLPDGFTTTVCPAAVEWWQRAASVLKQGHLLTFDYGLTAEEFFSPVRAQDTLRAYHQHRVTNDVLANVGEQDLTAHVNFSTVQAAGESAGLITEGLFPQGMFLTRVVEAMFLESPGFEKRTEGQVREFQTLTHPDHLGERFKVLVQTR